MLIKKINELISLGLFSNALKLCEKGVSLYPNSCMYYEGDG